ncbi:30S ribosomal protein S2 [Candidatus Woesebacteria bacterium]|nr:30S ribosomal protein S2 [Candidatus Woesebacteria bacterium]
MAIDVSLTELLDAGAHFGHQTKRWNPKMAPYIYGSQDGVHVFDLTKTKEALLTALEFLTKAKKEGKVILLVGCKKQTKDKLRQIGEETNTFFVSERWFGGTLTNFSQIKVSLKKLTDMKAKMTGGEYSTFTKKERLLIDREIGRLDRFLGGLEGIESVPDVIFIVDTHKEAGVVKEARRMKITTVGIVDSNADPTLVDYPIPMNDDAVKALDYVLDLVKKALTVSPAKEAKPKEKKNESDS